MAFQYRLESLLRLQRSIEHQEENRLLACSARVAGLRADLQVWEELRLRRRENVCGDLSQGTSGIFLQFAADWDQSVRQLEKEIRRQLEAAVNAQREQMQSYRKARQKREVLESLKQQGETAYTTELLRRIQQGLDETHLIRNFASGDRSFLPDQ